MSVKCKGHVETAFYMLNIGSKNNKTKNYGLIICMSFANRLEEYFKNRSVKQTCTFFIKKILGPPKTLKIH